MPRSVDVLVPERPVSVPAARYRNRAGIVGLTRRSGRPSHFLKTMEMGGGCERSQNETSLKKTGGAGRHTRAAQTENTGRQG